MTPNTRRRLAAFVFASIAALSSAPGTSASVPPVVVRVYGTASEATSVRGAAITAAADIVAAAGVAAEWHDCTGRVDGSCNPSRRVRHLIVRVVSGSTGPAPGARISLRGTGDARVALGFAVVDGATGAAALATVFLDRVEPVAQRTGVSCGELLGRAIAHEVGHLLLRTNRHGRTGLMREVWTDAELALNRPDDWLFAAADRRLLQK